MATTTYDVGFWPSATAPTHEDLMDVCTILDSFQTPFFSSAPKVRATDIVHSWTVDTLLATATAGAVEGIAFASASATAPIRQVNVCQEFSKHIEVSDRERASRVAGIRDMYEHQIMKGFKEIARNYEARVFAATIAVSSSATGDNTTASRLKAFRGFPLVSSGSAGTTVTTGDIIGLSRLLFQAGAEPDSIWFSPGHKQQFITNTVGTGGVNVRNIAATDQRLVANIDVFETPFNQLMAIITDRFIETVFASQVSASALYYIGDRSMAKVAVWRPPQHQPMGKGGTHTRGIVLLDATLQLDHPSAWAMFSGVTSN